MRILSLKANSAVAPFVVCAFGGCVTISGRGAGESAALNSSAEQVDARLYLISQIRRRPFWSRTCTSPLWKAAKIAGLESLGVAPMTSTRAATQTG